MIKKLITRIREYINYRRYGVSVTENLVLTFRPFEYDAENDIWISKADDDNHAVQLDKTKRPQITEV